MSDDEQTRPPWRTRPTGAGYAAGTSTGGDERVPAVEQVEDAGPRT